MFIATVPRCLADVFPIRVQRGVMKRFPFWCVVAAGLSATACDSSNPTTPTTTTTTTATAVLAITPSTGVLLIGQTQAFSTLNAASTVVVTTWTSSDPSILTIDAGGSATAVAKGTVTITAATDDGKTATQQVFIAPNYQGTWTGTNLVIACTDIAGFLSNNYCAQHLRTPERLTMVLSQINLAVAGTITRSEAGGQAVGSVSGVVGSGGDLATLVGSLSGVVSGSNQTMTLISWNSLATNASMTGTWAATITSPQVVGVATVQWSFSGVALTAP